MTVDPAEIIRTWAASAGVPVTEAEPGAWLVTLPGERRYKTLVWLLLGDHDLLIESFLCRRPDENTAGVHEFLLQRNARMRTVAYALDGVGDIHLVGRIGRESVTEQEIDTVLGVLLETADRDFNPILERGFASAIRREWAWRNETGQSVKHLRAFTRLLDQ